MPAVDHPLIAFAGNPLVAERLEHLLAGMTSAWPRRGRRLLAVSSGRAPFLEALWQAGFDLTVQDEDPEALAETAALLRNRAERILGAPDHLPVDDCTFDFAVALVGPDDPLPALLEEMRRVACRGSLLLFASAWSVASLECRLRTKRVVCESGFLSPRVLRREAKRAFGPGRRTWGSVLPGHSATWTSGFFCDHLNSPLFPLPLAGIAALRIDMAPARAGTPLVVRAAGPVTSAE